MVKGFGAEIELQIKNSRDRMSLGRLDGVELIETNSRLTKLSESLRNIGPSGDSELFRYFPVAAIAILEGHFKATVATIVNSGSPYLERGLQLAKDRLKSAVDAVSLLHRQVVTVGDLVAYVIPFNSVSSLENTFNCLFDENFKQMVSRVNCPYELRNQKENPIFVVDSVDDLWQILALTFEKRHILAHEPASEFPISYADAALALDGCALFVNALDALMWSTIWKDKPLTQYEMNVAAWSSCKEERGKLAAILRKALHVATEKGERPRFCRMHREWKAFNDQWLAWEDEPFAMGSIRPLLNADSQERALVARRGAVEGWLSLMCHE